MGASPEAPGWFAGDIHVHRSCGGSPVPLSTIYEAMNVNNLAVVSLLADSGNGEVLNPVTDLPLINGLDDAGSTANRILHWDAEWHWDATYSQYSHQALGGHVLTLGITNAQQIWHEYTYPVLKMARDHGGVGGFAHMQYLGDSFPNGLNCCLPIEYPVEVALGSADFVSQDVTGSDTAMQAWYRLLNCGFRPGFAAGSDYPCSANIGDLLTYVKVDGTLTYKKYIDGIKAGRTVVSRNAHREFLDLKVNASAVPGDEINLAQAGSVPVVVVWTATQNFTGSLEIVQNGNIVASQTATVSAGTPVTLNANVNFTKSGWLVARRMSSRGHEVHTGAIFVKIGGAPIRTSVTDAEFYVDWMNQLLQRTSVGGVWASYYQNNRAQAHARIDAARTLFQQIATDAANLSWGITTEGLPAAFPNVAYSAQLHAAGGTTPYTWSVVSGSLPAGLSLSANGQISGTPSQVGITAFSVRAADSSNPQRVATKSLTLDVAGGASIWPTSSPLNSGDGDSSAVELGLKFQSSASGNVTGIRFYKSPGNTGLHTGKIWSASGALLASTTFVNETPSGWQFQRLSSPLSITANTTYIVSYHAPAGRYAADSGYFNSAFSNGPLRALSNSESGGNGVYRYGSSAFPDQTWGAANYWVDVLFDQGSVNDTTPPTIVLRSPGASEIGVSPSTAITVTFSEPVQTATVNSSTIVLRNAANSIIPTTLSYNSATATVTIQPGSDLSLSSTYSVTVVGGASGIKDIAGNALASNATWSFATASSVPRSIWNSSVTPAVVADSETSAVEVGLKFQSAVPGTIAGVRFYKGTGNNGPHVGNLWTSSGTLLRSVTFNNETASGWQSQAFATPVQITPNTTYVISYHAPNGRYAVNSGYFQSGGFSNLPLRALANGEDGGNGVYRYGATGFPSQSWNGANYWVDVLFLPEVDNTAPTIADISPAENSNNVGAYANVTVTFSESIDPATLGSATLQLRDAQNNTVASSISYDAATKRAILTPATPLALSTTYSASAIGGASGVKDLAGNPLATTRTWQFTTATQAPRSLWSNAIVPTVPSNSDSGAVELGVKFSSAVDGQVTGVRFYKGAANSGPHRGNLWDVAGNLLGTVQFQDETATGWQFQAFTTPVNVSANTTYVISYHAPAGGYALDSGYFAGTAFNNYPLRAPSTAESSGNGLFRYGASAFPNQTWNGGNYWVDVVFQPAHESVAPTVLAVQPAQNAVGVFPDATISVRFSEGLQPSTVSASSVRLLAPGGATVPAVVSYDPGTFTATIDPLETLALQATYTVRALSGASGVKDLAGNALAAEFNSTFSTLGEVPKTIWPNSITPALLTDPDPLSIELGLKFRASVNGYVAGVRFYKGPENIGPHIGNIWSASGTLLGTVTFQNETASGWQYQALPSPVPVTANTTYVVSYHTASGKYSINDGYFLSTGIENSPLTALSNVEAGGNGLFRYGASSFPSQFYNGANFWVDLVFVENIGPDATAPQVLAVSPLNNANNVVLSSSVSVRFSETIASSTVNSSTILIRDAQNNVVPTSASYGTLPYTAVATPMSPLSPSSTYFVTVKGGTAGIKDLAGNPLTADFQSSFTTTAPDTTPPQVTTVSPYSGASGVGTAAPLNVTVSFNEAINGNTVSGQTLFLRDSGGNLIPAVVSFANNTATLISDSTLIADTTYTATVKGGTTGVSDTSGNRLATDFTWSFKTISSNPYGNGPGGPILLVTDESNPFSLYYAEILLTEGLNAFAILDRDSLTAAALSQYDVAILGSFALTPTHVSLLSAWVNNGGNLIAMRPDKQLAALAGLSDAGTTLSEAYLLVNTSSGPGIGIVGETMQFHGTADRYTLSGASSVATLYSTATTVTANPAVTMRSVGSNGGQVVVFTYDLAKSIVLTRQGNPAWAGQERDGNEPLRSNDLFYGPAANDPQPNWNDFSKIAIPQADEQQRLLANLITTINSDQNLLPRFWYFPHGHKAAIVMTGDDHAQNGSTPRFDQYLAYTPAGASVADWDAVRSSSYVWNNTPIPDSQAAYYNSLGFELALHINTGSFGGWICGNYNAETVNSIFTQQLNAFRAQFPSLPSPATLRMHCIAWSGYTVLPEVCLPHGIRLETSYYYFPGSWVQNRPGLFTGSGMAMRFASAQGGVIDVYQAATQMTDESGQSYPFTSDVLLDRALGPEGYYGAFVANMHTDVNPFPQSDAIVQSAQSRGVPIISALQLLKWLDSKNGSSFGNIAWNNNRQQFSINASPGAVGLMAMVPVPAGYEVTAVRRNSAAAEFAIESVKGVEYAMFYALTGNYEVDYLRDTVAPTVNSVTPTNAQTAIAPDSAVTITFSEAIDPATVTASTIRLQNPQGTAVPSTTLYDQSTFTVTLIPNAQLAAGTTYTVAISGGSSGVKDFAGNPLQANFASTFTTVPQVVYSIWPDTTTPSTLAESDSSAVELGLKFRSSVSGSVRGVRFYKGPGNTGTHRGSLWSATGTLLGTVVFQNETASGWQTALFTTPIAINANTTYVVSYHAPVGRYSVNGGFFTSGGVDRPPLRALSAAESGGNGVYRYSGTSAFPNQTWNGGNYWVDVIFQTNP
ncbi:MAG TPA: DUF4082 domain-containing protein [Verrucomicrobiae bacterium]